MRILLTLFCLLLPGTLAAADVVIHPEDGRAVPLTSENPGSASTWDESDGRLHINVNSIAADGSRLHVSIVRQGGKVTEIWSNWTDKGIARDLIGDRDEVRVKIESIRRVGDNLRVRLEYSGAFRSKGNPPRPARVKLDLTLAPLIIVERPGPLAPQSNAPQSK